MSYETPPTVSPEVTTAISTLTAAINTNYKTIADQLLKKCLNGLTGLAEATAALNQVNQTLANADPISSFFRDLFGIDSPADLAQQANPLSEGHFIPPAILTNLIENQIIPITQRHDSGWINHPSDPRGPMMKGVTLTFFRRYFNRILIETNITEITTAAANVDRLLPKWRNDDTQGQQYLYQLLSDQKATALWIWNGLTAVDNRWPAITAAFDPYLGYLLFDFTWTSGPPAYLQSGTNIDGLAISYGWDRNPNNWLSFVASLGDKSPQFTMDLLAKRASFINGLIKKTPEFEQGWMGRFINNPGSNLDYLVVINENFNYNKKSLYTFSEGLKNYLLKKGKIYETLKITI